MPQPNFTPEAINVLFYLLDGQGQVSITHDRPPNGAWFVEVTDVWTEMITRTYTHPDISVALMKAAEKKAKVLGLDLDEILNPIEPDEEIEEDEEEDE
ncbi:hypothetical protein LCGC14_1255560 [marine sediment metagenome]|uniref:Uncharacterized protein n=1 Tax=marine sediment metagenome TaxID=412755 RepID=A0A0F9L4Y8_9ZZZZ